MFCTQFKVYSLQREKSSSLHMIPVAIRNRTCTGSTCTGSNSTSKSSHKYLSRGPASRIVASKRASGCHGTVTVHHTIGFRRTGTLRACVCGFGASQWWFCSYLTEPCSAASILSQDRCHVYIFRRSFSAISCSSVSACCFSTKEFLSSLPLTR